MKTRRGYGANRSEVCAGAPRLEVLPLAAANLALRFLLEIAALAALAYAGFAIFGPDLPGWIAAAAFPLVFVAAWGTYVAPRAPRRLSDPAKAVLEALLFAGAAVALGFAGLTGLAVLLAVFVAGNIAAMFYFHQREM